MRGQPTSEDLCKLREFQEILQLPTRQEIRLALIKEGPASNDPADCICEALKNCAEEDNPCPHCRTLDPYAGCPQLGYGYGCGCGCGCGCGLLTDACECCTPEQKQAAARGPVR